MLDPPTDIRKLANAFMTDAAPSDDIPSFAVAAAKRYKRKKGGLNVPAGDIRAVRHEFGWVTGIVVVEHARGEFRFRCFGAKRLAATMAANFKVA
jgi:hypothetical protein